MKLSLDVALAFITLLPIKGRQAGSRFHPESSTVPFFPFFPLSSLFSKLEGPGDPF